MPGCAECSQPSTLTCTTCRKIHYCSQDCLEADAYYHNIICQAVANFTEARPSSDHYAAFVFPEPPAGSRDDENEDENETTDAPAPSLVWIKSIYNNDEDNYESVEDEIKAAMGIDLEDPIHHVTEDVDSNDSDEKFIRIWRHKLAGLMGLEYNSIIKEIDDDCDWTGPVLIQTGIAGELLQPFEMRDMGATEMKDIITFCRIRGRSMG